METKLNSEYNKLLIKYPCSVPVIIKKDKNCKNIPDLDKNKFLINKSIIFAQLLHIIRKRLKIGNEKTIFLFVNDNIIPSSNQTILEMYDKHNDEGVLYITYTTEDCFG